MRRKIRVQVGETGVAYNMYSPEFVLPSTYYIYNLYSPIVQSYSSKISTLVFKLRSLKDI